MKLPTSVFVFLTFSFFFTFAQHEKDNWYFGSHAALNFNTGTPVVLSGSNMYSNEGNATISDASGNLLFYTNGMQVFDRNNIVMPNGNGLASDIYATQSSLIVPLPGSSTHYYLFTMNTWEFTPTDLRYSIIDMSLNGGFGDVTSSKNVLVNNNAREQLTAIKHNNGSDYWIVIHEALNHHFDAYQLSASGLNTVPSVSDVGMDYDGYNRFGVLRFSHKCNKLVSVLGAAYSTGINETIQLYDFNNNNGNVSNPITLGTFATLPTVYAAEFSSDDSKLYVTAYNLPSVYQFNMNAVNIAASVIDIANNTPGTKCGLCLADNGKIYVGMSYQHYISVINNPNLPGLNCNFQLNSLNLGSGSCGLGLPNFYSNCEWKTSFTGELNVESGVSVYPNPATGYFNLEVQNNAAKNITLFNVVGDLVFSKEIDRNLIRIEISSLPKGLYIIKVYGDGWISQKKLIKQ